MALSISKAQSLVRDFHVKHGFPVDGETSTNCLPANRVQLDHILDELKSDAVTLGRLGRGDDVLYRLHLLLEELAELGDAVLEPDEHDRRVKTADALGDLLYVLLGTAESLGLDLESLFTEIHNSNMTKKPRDKKSNFRMRDKGPDYVKPNIAEAIVRGTKKRQFARRLANGT